MAGIKLMIRNCCSNDSNENNLQNFTHEETVRKLLPNDVHLYDIWEPDSWAPGPCYYGNYIKIKTYFSREIVYHYKIFKKFSVRKRGAITRERLPEKKLVILVIGQVARGIIF